MNNARRKELRSKLFEGPTRNRPAPTVEANLIEGLSLLNEAAMEILNSDTVRNNEDGVEDLVDLAEEILTQGQKLSTLRFRETTMGYRKYERLLESVERKRKRLGT